MSIGIDFGTTNTVIAGLNEKVQPEVMRFGSPEQAYDLIPTVMATCDRLQQDFFGICAKNYIGHQGYTVYQNCKMHLGATSVPAAPHWPTSGKNPEEVTTGFLHYVITELLRKDKKLHPRRACITMPVAWDQSGKTLRRDWLKNCIQQSGIRQVEVTSEPVAAAVYYLHRHQMKKKQPFSGHLLVCDCGGGTLDFCLVKVNSPTNGKPELEVLRRTGTDRGEAYIGNAGVAYDQAVVDQLEPGLKEVDTAAFHSFVRDFERNKIAMERTLDTWFEAYKEDSFLMEQEPEGSLFPDYRSRVEVKPALLLKVFDQVVKPGICNAISQVLSWFNECNVHANSPQEFRILMVGGFSSFYPVRSAILDLLQCKSSDYARLEDILTREDRTFAIAKGAALLAGEMSIVVERCPVDIGFRICQHHGDSARHHVDMLLCRKNELLCAYVEPAWLPRPCIISSLDMRPTIFIAEDQTKTPRLFQPCAISDLFQRESATSSRYAENLQNARFDIGLSITEDSMLFLHVRKSSDPGRMYSRDIGYLSTLFNNIQAQ